MVDKSKFKPYATSQGAIYWYDGVGTDAWVRYDEIGDLRCNISRGLFSSLVPLDEWAPPVDDGVYFATTTNGLFGTAYVKGGKRFTANGNDSWIFSGGDLINRIGNLPDEFKVADE